MIWCLPLMLKKVSLISFLYKLYLTHIVSVLMLLHCFEEKVKNECKDRRCDEFVVVTLNVLKCLPPYQFINNNKKKNLKKQIFLAMLISFTVCYEPLTSNIKLALI